MSNPLGFRKSVTLAGQLIYPGSRGPPAMVPELYRWSTGMLPTNAEFGDRIGGARTDREPLPYLSP